MWNIEIKITLRIHFIPITISISRTQMETDTAVDSRRGKTTCTVVGNVNYTDCEIQSGGFLKD